MATSLSFLREVVIAAATKGMADMQLALAVEAETVISSEDWDWYWSKTKTEKRNIVDTATLRDTVELTPVERNGSLISASLIWNPIQEEGKYYGDLVHNGAKDFFENEDEPEDARDYAARPWTFRLAPKEARDSSQLNAIAGEDPENYDETSWNVALKQFNNTLKASIATRFPVA